VVENITDKQSKIFTSDSLTAFGIIYQVRSDMQKHSSKKYGGNAFCVADLYDL
jgi:hypothetical protein